jgi:hypothetical protein
MYIDGYVTNLREQKERAQSKYPEQLSFGTGWVFVGYHDSFSWREGPMTKIVYRSSEGKAYLKKEDDVPYHSPLDGVARMVTPLPKGRADRRDLFRSDGRRIREQEDPIRDGRSTREQEDLIRWKICIDEDSSCGIPTLGDVLRVSKVRRLIIAGFRTNGLANQMVFPPLIADPLTPTDETGVEFDVGSLIIVRDVQLGAYPDRPAAVWCRVAACEKGIPQCDQALNDSRKVNP